MSEGASGVYDVGNIVCYTGVPGVFISVEPSKISTIPNTYRPIGIVVVPTSHDVYGDGSAGVMSLTWMSLKYPRTGYASTNTNTANNQLYMGYNGTLGDNLPLRNNLYIDGVKTTFSPTQSYLWNPFSDTNVPKPYLADGIKKNKAYFTQGDDVWGLDFGDSNHNILIAKSDEFLASQNYTTAWRNKTDFTNDDLCNHNPAMACLCAEVYRTNGTNAGDWYAPSSGELVYAMCKWDELYNSMQLLKQTKGSSFIWENPFTATGAYADSASWVGIPTTPSFVKSASDANSWPACGAAAGGYLVAMPSIYANQARFQNGFSTVFSSNLAQSTFSMAFTKMKLQ